MQFKITAPYEIKGKTRDATHTFKLKPLQVLKGTGSGYHLESNNDFGQDATLLMKDSKAYFLIGANTEITKQLWNKNLVKFGERPFSYQGHFLNYTSSIYDGKPAQLTPAQYQTEYSMGGMFNRQYQYFLVTKINKAY
jgi:hypothetical protein